MFYLVVVGIIVVLALIATVGAAIGRTNDPTVPHPVAPVVLGIILVAIVSVLFSFTRVDHREVAIVTSMGKYDSTIATGGVHWIKPWSGTEKFDQTLQPVDLVDISVSFSDGGDVEGLDEIGGGKGLIDATVRWQISKDQEDGGAKALWEKHRTFEKVSNDLVNRSARDAVIDAANDFPAATAIISQGEIAEKVEEQLTSELSRYGIIIDSVSIPAIDLDAGTQAAVDKIFTTQQDIKRAENEQIRAKIDAETVRIREAEGALSPAANQRYCYDVVNNWNVVKNGPLPATFNCSVGGNDTPVIVNGTTTTP